MHECSGGHVRRTARQMLGFPITIAINEHEHERLYTTASAVDNRPVAACWIDDMAVPLI